MGFASSVIRTSVGLAGFQVSSSSTGDINTSNDKQRRIEQRAREIWEREGRPEGRDEEHHWRLAEAELVQEAAQEEARAQPQRRGAAEVAEDAAAAAKAEEESKAKAKAAEAAKSTERKPLVASTSMEKKPATPEAKRESEPKKAPTKNKG